MRAALTVGADGRHSILRDVAGLELVAGSPPMDVLWFRLPRVPTDGEAIFGRTAPGRVAVFFNRGDYWQVAFVIPKGGADTFRTAGIERLRQQIVGIIFGVRMYTDGRFERFLTQRSMGSIRLLKFGPGPALPVTLILDGFGLSLIAVALWIGRNALTLALLWVGCAVIMLSVVLYMVAPRWSRPKWMSPD